MSCYVNCLAGEQCQHVENPQASRTPCSPSLRLLFLTTGLMHASRNIPGLSPLLCRSPDDPTCALIRKTTPCGKASCNIPSPHSSPVISSCCRYIGPSPLQGTSFLVAATYQATTLPATTGKAFENGVCLNIAPRPLSRGSKRQKGRVLGHRTPTPYRGSKRQKKKSVIHEPPIAPMSTLGHGSTLGAQGSRVP